MAQEGAASDLRYPVAATASSSAGDQGRMERGAHKKRLSSLPDAEARRPISEGGS